MFAPTVVFAQDEFLVEEVPSQQLAPDRFFSARVLEVVREEDAEVSLPNADAFSQLVRVQILEEPYKDEEFDIEYGGLRENQRLTKGERVVLVEAGGERGEDVFYIFDRYRLTPLYLMLGLFAVLAVVFARWKGVSSLAGLALSVLVLGVYVVPQLLAGKNTFAVILIGGLIVSTVSIYLAHGFNRKTTVALAGTLITICLAMGLSAVFVWASKLFGLGSEEAFFLQSAPIQDLNLHGLLLGGIIIGTLGVLDDVTTTQAATVNEIARANPKLTRRELYQRASLVGREHITSLVNTLVLAYVGASFPALLLFVVYQRPFWVVLNSEVIAEEIVRTLVGSIALMCAVPITTALAAYFLPGKTSESDSTSVPHVH